MRNNLTTKLLIGLTGAVAVAAIVGAPFLYYTVFYRKAATELAGRKAVVRGDPTAVAAKLSELIYVPTGETPRVLPAGSPEFAGMAFFREAAKGDLAVIYNKAGKIYLFDPVAVKIRDVASLSAPPPPAPPIPTLVPSPVASPSGSLTPTKAPSLMTPKPTNSP